MKKLFALLLALVMLLSLCGCGGVQNSSENNSFGRDLVLEGVALLHKSGRQASDVTAALSCFEEAASLGSDEALFLAGWTLDWELNGVDNGFVKAMEYYRQCTESRPYALICMAYLYRNGQGVSCDKAKADELFSEAMSLVDTDILLSEPSLPYFAEACDLIGCMYESGHAVEQDYDKAMEWYLKAVEAGCSFGMSNIGNMYRNASGVEQDYDKAMEWYLKAADAGYSNAMSNIGDLYYLGNGVEKDYVKAMEWYLKAADAGNSDAMTNIGYMYKKALGVERDYDKAMEWYLKAADAGSPHAMNDIGDLYYLGNGVEKDYVKAMEWYQKGVDGGERGYGLYSIAALYIYGYGVEKDPKKGIDLLTESADAGYSDSMYWLGILYRDGDVVTRDPDKAMEWFLKAADAGNSSAMNQIGYMYDYALGVEEDIFKAMEWYLKAADAGSAAAMNNIGYMYQRGYGSHMSFSPQIADQLGTYAFDSISDECFASALEWFLKAADAGSAAAMRHIGFLYENGYGVEPDYDKAMEWYKKADNA